jgi:hypothetical protein
MRHLLVFGIAAGLLCIALAQTAQARCVKNGIEYPPIAIADGNGDVDIKAPTGQTVYVSKLPANAEVCQNLLFTILIRKCATPNLHMEGARGPKFCKGGQGNRGCVHIACDEVRVR